MADNTQGKAQQKPAAGGPSNPRAVTRGEQAADRRSARGTERARATRAVDMPLPENTVANPGGKDDDRPTAEQIAKRDPKTYRALERGYIDGKIVEGGEVFTTQQDQGSWMEPVKKSEAYGVDMAVEEASMAKKVDVVYEDLSDAALEVFCAMNGVSKPAELSRDEKIEAIRAARRVDAQ